MIVLNDRMYEAAQCEYITTATLLAISAALAVVGTGVSAYGAYQQGQSQKAVADYNAKISENNAIAARQQAEAEASRIRDRGRRLLGSQIAAVSKSGLTLSGSANDVIYDSAINVELDALTSIYKGSVSASAYRSSGNLSRFEGDTAAGLGTIEAGGTILSGITKAGQYYGMSRNAAKTAYPTIQ